MDSEIVPTYIINLEKRQDRKAHVIKQFSDKQEFEVRIVKAFEENFGNVGLWKTVVSIIEDAVIRGYDYVLVCEDDHQFTNDYSKDLLFDSISIGQMHQIDLLVGGASWIGSIFSITKNVIWIDKFTGLQFTVIFSGLYERILGAAFALDDAADLKLSTLTNAKFLIFPYISTQKEFGYSDATPRNRHQGVVSDLFIDSSNAIMYLLEGEEFYHQNQSVVSTEELNAICEELCVTTYIRVENCDSGQSDLYSKEFEGRAEFEIHPLMASFFESTSFGQLFDLRRAVEDGLNNRDDVIIFCTDSHRFTIDYSKEYLIKNIVEAHNQGVDIVCGVDEDDFNHSVPVSENRIWVNKLPSANFIIIYSAIFEKILAEEMGDESIEDFLSRISSNIVAIVPGISQGSTSGVHHYSLQTGQNQNFLCSPQTRLLRIQDAYSHFMIRNLG